MLIILYNYCVFIFSAHAITSDVNIVDTALAAEFFLSDGVIITGSHTGQAADSSELNGSNCFHILWKNLQTLMVNNSTNINNHINWIQNRPWHVTLEMQDLCWVGRVKPVNEIPTDNSISNDNIDINKQ